MFVKAFLSRHSGRKFVAFLWTSSLLALGLYVAPQDYATYANVLGLVFSVFLGGQAAVDWKNGKTP